ncbi:MAG: bifunctional diaminohydroxyphosphoribosylaminopyrimidine deaminase/5-amino-6-(5-phosphoribosylamino)uracil reductase RibD [Desulfurivibrionaceae bacterium]
MSKKAADGSDQAFMEIALRQAGKGLGRTSPNPCVGAVIVKDGRVVATGWHTRAGEPHAEIVALKKAGARARQATIYVTLEPCNHTGRTPPCTKAIVESGISRVVTAMDDPNPLVSGQGNAYLESQGIAVTTGVLEDKSRKLNLPFEKVITTGLPWIVLKAGVSMDGRIAPSGGKNCWITGESSRRQVHRMRDRLDAILVGSSTALIDDPSLNVRLGSSKSSDPLRLVLDTHLALSPRARMLNGRSGSGTWIFCGPEPDEKKAEELERAGARVVPSDLNEDGHVDIYYVMRYLAGEGINSVLVEGGGGIHTEFLRRDLVDRINLFFAPIFLGAHAVPLVADLGLASLTESRRFKIEKSRRFGDDIMVELAREQEL